jgi:phosphoserine aminotransferase
MVSQSNIILVIMRYDRLYNFSVGPATMPMEVLEEVAAEMMNDKDSGICVIEMSHRSKAYQTIIDEAEGDVRVLMGIPARVITYNKVRKKEEGIGKPSGLR